MSSSVDLEYGSHATSAADIRDSVKIARRVVGQQRRRGVTVRGAGKLMKNSFLLPRLVQFENKPASGRTNMVICFSAVDGSSIQISSRVSKQSCLRLIPVRTVEAVYPNHLAGLIHFERRATADSLAVTLALAHSADSRNAIKVACCVSYQLPDGSDPVVSVKRVQHLELRRLRLSGNNY